MREGGKKEFILFPLFKAFKHREKVGDKHTQVKEDEFDPDVDGVQN